MWKLGSYSRRGGDYPAASGSGEEHGGEDDKEKAGIPCFVI
jgi:hypothetical protein